MRKRLILFILGIALTLFVIHIFGFDQTVSVLATANIELVALAFVMQLVIQGLLAARIMVIAYQKGYMSFKTAFLTTQSGIFVSLITPIAKIGGEPLKIYMLRNLFDTSKASAIVAMDSFVEIISSVIVVLFSVVLFAPQLSTHMLFIFSLFFIITFLIVGVVLKIMLTPRWLAKIVSWITKQISKFQNVDNKDYTTLFYKAFTLLIRDKKMLVISFGLSFFIKILEFVRIWIIFLALGFVVPFSTLIIVWSIVLVLLMIPWLPGSLGLVEFGAVSGYLLFNMPNAIATSAVVLDRLVAFWFVLFIGLACIYVSKKKGLIPKLEKKHDITKVGAYSETSKYIAK